MAVSLLADGQIQNAQGILDASGVTIPTGDLANGAYDEMGNLYQIPEQVISDPVNMALASQDIAGGKTEGAKTGEETDEDEVERRREEKGKGVLKNGDSVKVRARLSDRGGPDVIVLLGKEQNVRVLVRRVQEEAGVKQSYVLHRGVALLIRTLRSLVKEK